MKLVELSRTYGEFYAPAFAIRLGESDLLRDLRLAVSQLQVDLELGMSSHFSFTITDCFNFEDHAFQNDRGKNVLELLDFDTKLDLCMGYGDAKSIPVIMRGLVTLISTNFPEGGSPELTIEGCDYGHVLTRGEHTNSWSNARDSTAVEDIAAANNLRTQVETTREQHPKIEQNNETNWRFIKKLADRNHFELYVDADGVLHFAKPKDTAAADLRLEWGQGLLSFKPEANLSRQVSKVEVHGWDYKQKKPIVGTATAGEESGRTGKSAGQRLQASVRDSKKQAVLRVRRPVHSTTEANQLAKAMLNERAKEFLTGDGETIGLPELRPDHRVFLTGLGELFSKRYYIRQATHRIDSGGYRTRFKVKEPGL